jgi:hypothetical protein
MWNNGAMVINSRKWKKLREKSTPVTVPQESYENTPGIEFEPSLREADG